jgi:hypothetical protein
VKLLLEGGKSSEEPDALLMSVRACRIAVLFGTVILCSRGAEGVPTDASKFFGDSDVEEAAAHPITANHLVFQREATPYRRRGALPALRILLDTDSLNNWADGPRLRGTVRRVQDRG